MEPEKDKCRLLIEHLPDACAYHQIVTDSSGKPNITVEDEGDGFDWRYLLDNKCLDLEGEEERDRGIAMTKAICDSLFYNEKGNKAFLVLDKN